MEVNNLICGIECGYLFGKLVIITDKITKKVRSRKHKKKRIDKKWLKRYGYKDVTDHSKILLVNNTLYMSQKIHDRLKEDFVKMGE